MANYILQKLSYQIDPYVIAKFLKNQYQTYNTNIPCQIDGNHTLKHQLNVGHLGFQNGHHIYRFIYITNGCVDPSCVCLHTKTCLYVVVWKLRN